MFEKSKTEIYELDLTDIIVTSTPDANFGEDDDDDIHCGLICKVKNSPRISRRVFLIFYFIIVRLHVGSRRMPFPMHRYLMGYRF